MTDFLGARISEIGNLRISDVTKEEHGFHIDVEGKTGRRTPIAVVSAPYLTLWLNTHPFADHPSAPLWTQMNNRANNLPNAKRDPTRRARFRYLAVRPHHSRCSTEYPIMTAVMTEATHSTRVIHPLGTRLLGR